MPCPALFLGIILLTKAEVVLAALIGALGGMIPLLMSPTHSRLRLVAVFVGMMLIPPVVALLLLECAMPFSDALAGMAGSWRWIADARLTRISYFRILLGIDDPAGNVWTILTWSGAYAAFLAAAVLAARLARGKSNRTIYLISIAIVLLFGAILWWTWPGIVWSQAGRPLPLAIGIIIVVLLIKLRRSEDRSRLVLPLAWSCFAGALLAKMLLKTNMYHYGFALAMPAAMLVLSVIVGTIPRWTADYGRGAWAPRAGVLVLLGTFLATVIHTNHRWLATRVHPVGSGFDAFLADERGAVMNRMLETIARLSTPGDTLVAIPEGPMLNYLARRVNPTRYQNFLPAEMMLFGEQNMLRELESTRPGFVAMVHANTTTYDATWFGEHYGLQIDAWIKANYLPVAQEGAIPFTSDAFGILLTQRKH